MPNQDLLAIVGAEQEHGLDEAGLRLGARHVVRVYGVRLLSCATISRKSDTFKTGMLRKVPICSRW